MGTHEGRKGFRKENWKKSLSPVLKKTNFDVLYSAGSRKLLEEPSRIVLKIWIEYLLKEETVIFINLG